MRRVDQLITQARLVSRNSANADGTFGISDNEVLQYLNDAQDKAQNLISAKKNIAKIFATQTTINVVANQEAYSIPDRVLMNKQIEQVEFSADGTIGNYVRLEKLNFFNRDTNTTTYPWGYFKRGGQIFLQPTPSNSIGTLRITYERDLDDLDIPRGIVDGILGSTSTRFDSITLDSTADAYESTNPGFSNIQYVSVVNALGARKCFNILVGSYDTGTNVLVPSPTPFLYTTGDSEILVPDVVVFGKYTTTFSQLPDSCERYLIHSAALDMFAKDSSDDYSRQANKVAAIEEDMLRTLMSQTSEVQYIPQQDRYEWF